MPSQIDAKMETAGDFDVRQAGLQIVRTVKALRKPVASWRAAGETIALVPTMGALHDGHLALVRLAAKSADRVVVSIFVNPAQFAPHEDLSQYPRDETGDVAKLKASGVSLVWAPDAAEMYPQGSATSVVPAGAALGLEGDSRPHHFGGVATVCLKLFNQVQPDSAIFGEKDFQQLAVIRQLVRDVDLNLKIISLKTVREKDGLAMSSRNRYLSAEDRARAPSLFEIISSVALKARQSSVPKLIKDAEAALLKRGFASVDYVAIRDAETLGPFKANSDRPGRVLVAAKLGSTRLIDNVSC